MQYADAIGSVATIAGLDALGLRALPSQSTAQIELGRTRSRWDHRARRGGGREVRCNGRDFGRRPRFCEVLPSRIRPIAARVVLELLAQILGRLSREARNGGGRVAFAVHTMTALANLRRC